MPKKRAPGVIDSSGKENPVKGKDGAMRHTPAETAITQVGESAVARSARPAMARMRSHPAAIQRTTGPCAPQPAQPAKPAVQTEIATSQTALQGRSLPTTRAEGEPPASASRRLSPPSRHSRESIERNPRSAPSAMRPGMKVGSM